MIIGSNNIFFPKCTRFYARNISNRMTKKNHLTFFFADKLFMDNQKNVLKFTFTPVLYNTHRACHFNTHTHTYKHGLFPHFF